MAVIGIHVYCKAD